MLHRVLGIFSWLLLTPIVAHGASSDKSKPLQKQEKQRTGQGPTRGPKTEASRGSRAKRAKVARRSRKRTNHWPPMRLEHANTREQLTVQLYDANGRTIKAAVHRLWRFMRCHTSGKRHAIHWRLIQRLYRISRHFKGRTIRVYSGYRSPGVARTSTSRHTKGRAIDFAIKGISTRRLRDHIRQTFKDRRGLGYYPSNPFVHFDVREKSAFWVDYSGKGEEPRYAKNPYLVLQAERKARKPVQTPAQPESQPEQATSKRVKGPQPLGPSPKTGARAPNKRHSQVSNFRSVAP